MTYREVAYIINDILKLVVSDDSYYEIDHILFLADKDRGYIIKKYYEGQKRRIPQSYYQEICMDIDPYSEADICLDGGYMKRSSECIPSIMISGTASVSPISRIAKPLILVREDRFGYCSSIPYYSPVYCSIMSDRFLYLKSSSPIYMNKVRVRAVFEDSSLAERMGCCTGDSSSSGECDVLDNRFPMEDNFLPELLSMVVNQLSTGSYKPADNTNNQKDDLSDIASFIKNYMKDYYTRNNINKNLDNQTIDNATI